MMGNIHIKNKVTASILAVSLSLILTGCETEEEAAESHLKRGKELLEKGDFAAAQLELKTAKQGNKSTGETYFYLALLDEKVRNYYAMQDNLEKALKLEPEHQQAHIKLGKLKLLMGEVAKALEHAEILLTKNPQDTGALVLKSSALLKEKKQDEALVIINSILETNAVHVEALTLKSIILMQQDKQAEALALMDKAIAEDEKNVALHLFKIQIHAKQNDVDAVIKDYLRLIALLPENDNYKVTLAKVYAKSGKAEEAESLLRKLVLAKTNDLTPKVLLLEFLAATASDKVDAQIQVFSDELAKQPTQLFDFAKWMLAKGNTLRAETMLKQVVAAEKNSDTGVEANILLAKIAFDSGDYASTEKIATDILADLPNQVDAKLLNVRLLLVKEQYAQAHAYLDKIIWSHPKSDEALVLIAQVYLVEGDRQKAQNTFKAALDINPANAQAVLATFNHLMAQQDIKYARELIGKALRKEPQNLVFLQKIVQLNMLEEKWDEASKAVSQLARLAKAQDLAKFYQANILQGQGEYEKAITAYKEILVKFPQQQQVLQNLSACYEKLNKRSEMVSFLQNQLKENKDNVVSALLLAELYTNDKKYTQAIDLIKAQPQIALTQHHLAIVYMAMGKTDKAISVYQDGLKAHPRNIRLSLALASLYEQQQKYKQAIEIYEQLIANNPELDVATNNLATLLVDHFPTADNLKRAQQLAQSFANSEQAYFQDTYAWVLLHNGDIANALKVFEQLIIKAPKTPVFRYHLGMAKYKNGNNSAALVQIDQAIELAKQGALFLERKAAEKIKQEIINKMRGH
ncbi:MAG: tetratricopeptide repeat protein [Methyloprofundus sp.]|nr:tetratricopeptide repeat protein [Methyloprofundus sp.]MDT8425672.1 tetratricopeptide repeat protein [Methyloprofundus sp.]